MSNILNGASVLRGGGDPLPDGGSEFAKHMEAVKAIEDPVERAVSYAAIIASIFDEVLMTGNIGKQLHPMAVAVRETSPIITAGPLPGRGERLRLVGIQVPIQVVAELKKTVDQIKAMAIDDELAREAFEEDAEDAGDDSAPPAGIVDVVT